MKSAISEHGFKLLLLSMLNTCSFNAGGAADLALYCSLHIVNLGSSRNPLSDQILHSPYTYLLDNHTLWCRIIETLLCTRCSYDCHWFIKNRRNVVRCLQRKQQPRNCSSCKCCCIFVLPALCFGRFSRWMQQFSRFGENSTHTCCIASCHRGALSRARPGLSWRWDVD